MNRSLLIAVSLAALAALPLGGCGGGANPDASPFQGRWAGVFATDDGLQIGSMRLDVTPRGTVTGEFANTTINMAGTVKGTIDDQGAFDGSFTVTQEFSEIPLAGTLARGADGHITGTLLQSGFITLNLDLLPRKIVTIGSGSGTITADDYRLNDGTAVCLVDFIPRSDVTVRITMESAAVNGVGNPYLVIYDANGVAGNILALDNNSGGGTAARVDFDFVQGRKYVIGFNTYLPGDYGDFTYRLDRLSALAGAALVPQAAGGPKSAR